MSHTDDRIKKLASKGLSAAQIARKIGRPDDLARVTRALGTSAMKRACHGCEEFAPFQGGVAFFCDTCREERR